MYSVFDVFATDKILADDDVTGRSAQRAYDKPIVAIDATGATHSWLPKFRFQQTAIHEELQAQSNTIDKCVSLPIGEVGERVMFTGTIEMCKQYDGRFGTTWFHIIKDMRGNVITYAGPTALGAQGDEISMHATVKDVSERDGVCNTAITSITII